MELTEQDREQIQNQIVALKAANALQVAQAIQPSLPLAPNGQDESIRLNEALTKAATPNKSEEKTVKKQMKKLWGFWRKTTLDSKSLEIEKVACQIAIERAETKAKLAAIKREQEVEKHKHWLKLNEGNLKDIGYNTESKPSIVWYGLKRMMFHIAKLTTDVPKIIFNTFWVALVILAFILLKNFGVI